MEERVKQAFGVTAPSTTVVQKPRTVLFECKICGASAHHSYVGVITCSSCKMFFKRNAETKQVR